MTFQNPVHPRRDTAISVRSENRAQLLAEGGGAGYLTCRFFAPHAPAWRRSGCEDRVSPLRVDLSSQGSGLYDTSATAQTHSFPITVAHARRVTISRLARGQDEHRHASPGAASLCFAHPLHPHSIGRHTRCVRHVEWNAGLAAEQTRHGGAQPCRVTGACGPPTFRKGVQPAHALA